MGGMHPSPCPSGPAARGRVQKSTESTGAWDPAHPRVCHARRITRPRLGFATKGGALARRARAGHLFFDHSPPVPVFAPTSPNNLEYLLAVSKNLAHPLHPVSDNGKGGGWKW